MPERLVVPYRQLGLGGVRPYLFLHVSGPAGHARMIPGLIDSGADRSVLPAGFAPLLGYTIADLVRVQGSHVAGSMSMLEAAKPSTAYVPELPNHAFEISPFFVHGCQQALWGRADLMLRFDVTDQRESPRGGALAGRIDAGACSSRRPFRRRGAVAIVSWCVSCWCRGCAAPGWADLAWERGLRSPA